MVQSSHAVDGLRKAVERAKRLPSLEKVLHSLDSVDEAIRESEEESRDLRLPYSSDPVAVVDRWR